MMMMKSDVSAGKCNHGDLTVVDWVEKVPAIITDVICPDGQSKCQTGQTCFLFVKVFISTCVHDFSQNKLIFNDMMMMKSALY
jgi:hypothetical protein